MSTNGSLNHDNRIDFVYFFDVKDGNPNGDPDAGNAPRTDPETGHGLVSDVALKRKVRDYVAAAKEGAEGYKIYVKLHSALHEQREGAYAKAKKGDSEKKGKEKAGEIEAARKWMCENYFDVRTFGAVMSVKDFNCGQVRGPLQVTFARSVDTIAELEQTIARKAVEKEDAEKQLAKDGFITGTLGRKSIVPYGLYRAHIFYNPHFAKQTGFGQEDLDLAVEALKMMFELDRSATRGEMSARALVAFQHSKPLGDAPASSLFERVTTRRRDETKPPRAFADYEPLTIDQSNLPEGVSVIRLLPKA
jgi:CRISPR-associated protein Csd2